MSKILEDKLSVTMKEAVARNSLAVNKMKADIGTIGSDAKRSLQSLEHYKQKYQKRQRELEREKQRTLSRTGIQQSSRKISAPSRLMVGIEYTDLSSGEFLTDLTELQRSPTPRHRSKSHGTVLPRLHRGESGGKFPEIVQPKGEGLTLPSIDALDFDANGRRRRLNSASNLNIRSISSGLTVPVSSNITQTRSAPSSPCMPRRAELRCDPSSRGRSRSPARGLVGALSLLDEVQGNKVPDLEEAMTMLKDIRHKQELEECRTKEQAESEETAAKKLSGMNIKEGKDDPKTRKISSPGTQLCSESTGGKDNGENQKTLEESMNDMRYCTYLRTSSLEEELLNEKLPDELLPKAIIVGHSEWVP